jgi:hypothetical protein
MTESFTLARTPIQIKNTRINMIRLLLSQSSPRKLKYLGGVAKNRKVIIKNEAEIEEYIRLDELAKSLSAEDFEKITLNSDLAPVYKY